MTTKFFPYAFTRPATPEPGVCAKSVTTSFSAEAEIARRTIASATGWLLALSIAIARERTFFSVRTPS